MSTECPEHGRYAPARFCCACTRDRAEAIITELQVRAVEAEGALKEARAEADMRLDAERIWWTKAERYRRAVTVAEAYLDFPVDADDLARAARVRLARSELLEALS